MGAVLAAAARRARARRRRLPHASSLCGACTAACPVKIPLHELLLDLRRDLVEEGVAPWWERAGFTLWSWAWSSALGYRVTTRARAARAAARRGSPGRGGSGRRAVRCRASVAATGTGTMSERSVDDFVANAEAVGCHVHRGAAPELEGAGVSQALYGLADTGSGRPGRVAGRAARATRSSRTSTSRCCEDRGSCRGSTSSSPRSATTSRARWRSSPARAGAPTSSRSSRSASTVPGGPRRPAPLGVGSCCRSTARRRSSASDSTTATTRRSRGRRCRSAPLLFAKWPNALIGPGEPIVIPPIVTKCDYEAELGVVIGERVRDVVGGERARGGRGLHLRQRRLRPQPPVRRRSVDARQVARHVLPGRPGARARATRSPTRRRSRSARC